jgi:hypothetical protein
LREDLQGLRGEELVHEAVDFDVVRAEVLEGFLGEVGGSVVAFWGETGRDERLAWGCSKMGVSRSEWEVSLLWALT